MGFKPCRLIDHAKRFDDASVEEDEVDPGRLFILGDVSLQDLAGELECRRARTRAAGQTLLDDGASALVNHPVAACAKGDEERGLAGAGAAGNDDATHAGTP
jgi:hypothetical protein